MKMVETLKNNPMLATSNTSQVRKFRAFMADKRPHHRVCPGRRMNALLAQEPPPEKEFTACDTGMVTEEGSEPP